MKQLNGLISTLKSKLKRGNGEEDEEEYEEEEEGEDEVGEETEASEVTSKAKKSKAKAKAKSDDDDGEEDEDEEDEEDDEDEASDEEAKKKKRVKIMGAVFAVVLLYVVADEMFLKTDDIAENAAIEETGGFKRPPKRDRTKKPNEAKTGTATETTEATTAEATPAAVPTEEALEIPTIDEATPVATATEPVAEATETFQATDPQVASNPFIDATPTPEANVGEEVTELTVPSPNEGALPISEGIDMEEAVAKDVKKEYVAPPKYDQIGRGLVYNCGGKHWACVDKQAYFQCKDNYLHNSSEQKTTECYPSEVYATYDDCKTVQVHHINMVKEIDFCAAN